MATIQGTSANNELWGTTSGDALDGLAGNDHLRARDGNDVLRGGDGYDVLIAEGGNDTLDGGALDDWFYGGVGNDVLTGGGGADRFVFETTLNSTGNVDTITDFATGSDKIWLSHTSFSKLTVNGALDASMLRIGSAAADGNDHIIYNRDTGALIYDSNGNAAGGDVQFATIGKGLNLTGGDFNVFGAPQNAPAPTNPTPTPTPSPTPSPTPAPTPAPTSPTNGVKLTKTGPIKSSYAGQVIENLDVWADSGNGITVTHDNVIIRNVRIHHKTGDGINVTNAKGVQITKAEIRNMDPPSGINGESDTSINNIDLLNAHDTKISYVTLRDGATGIYANYSPRTIVDHADGYNFHGGFPRGQFVQFGYSDGSKLTNFYTRNELTKSRTEDNVNVYHSNNVVIENGVIDGNNSRSGVGVLFEGDSGGGVVRNVDAVRMSNGGFSSYSNNVDFFDVRVFDGHMNTASGRGAPLSNGVSFAVTASGVGYDDATYTRPANPNNVFWGSQPAEFKDIRHDPGAVVMDNSSFTNEWNWIV